VAFRERFELLIDVVTGQSTSNIGKLRNEFAQADGAMAKTKVAAGGVFDLLKANAVPIAAGAGVAIAAFAAKAVSDFQSTALGAGQLRDSLGVTAEEASRLQEVAGDLGIGVNVLEKSMGRMNRAATDTPEAFDRIGASIARSRDGTVNVTQTFLNAIDALNRIPDASKRASAAQEIFGRGWMEISELVEMGASGVREAMASVEQSKIIDDAEVARAREFRDRLDDLRGVIESVVLEIGGALVPVLTEVANAVKTATDATAPLAAAFEKITNLPVVGTLTSWLGPMQMVTAPLRIWGGLIGGVQDAWNSLRGNGGVNGLIRELGVATEGASDATKQYAENVKSGTAETSTFEARLAAAATTAGRTEGALAAEAAVMEDVYESATEGKARLEAMNAAQERAEQAAQDAADALRDEATALQEQADAMRGSVDAGFALRDSQRDAAVQFVETNTVAQEQAGDMEAMAAAMDDAAQAAISVADNEVRVAGETAKAAGQTQTASEASSVYNRSLLQQAASTDGPARSAILNYIGAVNGIPPEKLTDIVALIAQGKIAEAEAILNSTSRRRESEVRAEANTAQAEREINYTARPRTVIINPRYGASLGPIGDGPRHTGGPVSPGKGYVIGRPGAEEFWQPDNFTGQSGRIHSNEDTRRMAEAAASGGGGVSITVNTQSDRPAEIASVVRATVWEAGLTGRDAQRARNV
jgi:hypothetical protein